MNSIFPISGPVDATKYRATDARKIHWIKNIGGGQFEVYAEGGYRVFLANGTSPVLDWRVELRPGESVPDPLAELAKRVEALEQWRRDREIRQAVPSKPPAEPTPTRPLQVGDRVRNAAGTDTGVVAGGSAPIPIGTVRYTRGGWKAEKISIHSWRHTYPDGTVDAWLHEDDGRFSWDNESELVCCTGQIDRRASDHDVMPDGWTPDADFDTQAREAGYVKAEEVADRLHQLWANTGVGGTLGFEVGQYIDELRAQAKGGAK